MNTCTATARRLSRSALRSAGLFILLFLASLVPAQTVAAATV